MDDFIKFAYSRPAEAAVMRVVCHTLSNEPILSQFYSSSLRLGATSVIVVSWYWFSSNSLGT